MSLGVWLLLLALFIGFVWSLDKLAQIEEDKYK